MVSGFPVAGDLLSTFREATLRRRDRICRAAGPAECMERARPRLLGSDVGVRRWALTPSPRWPQTPT